MAEAIEAGSLTRGEDDDGHAAVPTATVTPLQARQLQALLDKCSDRAKEAFTNLHGSTAEVDKGQFDRVLGQLKKSAENAEAQNANHQ